MRVLPIVGKLLEKHIDTLCNIRTSTTAVLLAATRDWLNSLDNKKDVFFDLQKAFDKVPHYQLLAKLKQLQLHPIVMTHAQLLVPT